jgi:hypothetical protein
MLRLAKSLSATLFTRSRHFLRRAKSLNLAMWDMMNNTMGGGMMWGMGLGGLIVLVLAITALALI